MKRVLFVNAADPFSEVENRYRPLWPAYLAAYAEKMLGMESFEFRFLQKGFERELEKYDPHIVAIGCVSQNYNFAMKYAALAKARKKAVITGGIHISVLPETFTKNMDVGCIGEGERTFVELLKHYFDNDGYGVYKDEH